MSKTPPTHKLSPIEGLRGYLAMVVVLSHIFFHNHLGGVLGGIDRSGTLAVKCFMIVSGFVIFMLIDKKREPYRVFFLRRMLRIFPVYLLLFLLSIPSLWLSGLTLDLVHPFQTPAEIAALRASYDSLWHNLWIHVPLHLLMIHGMIPVTILPNSDTAFLGPAWSLSLEWQFYVVAPAWYALFLSRIYWHRFVLYALLLFFVLKSHYLFQHLDQGGFLPLQIPFFLAGSLSYFIYDRLGPMIKSPDFVLPTVTVLSLGIFQLSHKAPELVPFIVWLVVFAVLLEPEKSISFRLCAPLLTNRAAMWLGRTSYSIYLSHVLVLGAMQYLVLRFFPGITEAHLLLALLVLVPAVTLPFSGLLYRMIEEPCILLGKRVTGEPTGIVVEKQFKPA